MKIIISIMIFCLVPMVMVSGQEQQAQKLLSEAVYQEEINGDLDEAIKIYRSVINQYPDNRDISAEALLHLGMCYEKLGSAQARQAYRDLISKYSDQTMEVALARERISRLDAYAAELMAKAEEHLTKGNELFKRWEYEAAIKEYENAVTCGPNTELALNARYCIGQSWYRAGKYDQALATFTKLIEENPESNIAPVTELMVAQLKYAIENSENSRKVQLHKDENTIIDTETGITYTKVKTLTGESDIINHTNTLNLSPNGKYLLSENKVIPMDGAVPFDLINYESTGVIATRATWSPDGTKVAFYSGDALCVVPVSPESGHTTGPLRKIKMDNLQYEDNPDWSPDSKRIAYTEGGKADLCIIDTEGNNFKQITDNDIFEFGPAWSSDGNTLVYNLEDRYIALYDIENNKFSKLLEIGRRSFPTWSPDGEWILYGGGGINFCNLNNKKVFTLSPPEEAGNFFSWSPDGQKMLFFRQSYDYNSRLKIASPNGGPSYEPVPLLVDYWHEWRNDSKSLAVWGENERGDIVMRITPISGGKSDVIHLDEMPEGKPKPYEIDSNFENLLFTIERDKGVKDIYAVPISANEARTTGPPVKIYNNLQALGGSLSPDGEKLAFMNERNIWIVYTNGNDPIQVTDFQEVIDEWDISWTPDGTSLLLSIPSGWRLLENPGPQGKMIKLLDEGKEIECSRWNFDISPDNTRVAVLTDQQIKIIPVNNANPGKVLDISDLELKGSLDLHWSPDGKSLAFIGRKEVEDKANFPDGKYLIYSIPLDGGPPIRIATDDDNLKYFLSWSPDSKWLAFSPENIIKIRPESTIWEADFKEILEKLTK